ncbi:hypothetical protein CYLTODRAFT_491795 [Cylindrobasidium torrendii FP15055 ss-10]|uniref:Wax synthase domain-containing protein n=1 Tax=Cylindrobasidium torrendii FP15055 ss-10 TaxID=1314674 RepID=A0A0D7B952_9AGAR|nr:hypothetical protein CYLTODRAFT_491795 [Cylindrobasidium torrendii FP15055 ss-10]
MSDPAGPFAYFGLVASLFLLLASVTARPSRWRFLFFIPIACINLCLIPLHFADIVADYSVHVILVGSLFLAFDFIISNDVQIDLRQKGQDSDIARRPLSERLVWGVRLILSLRGVGWLHEPTKSLRPGYTAQTSRTSFIAQQLCITMVYIVISDIASTYARTSCTFLPEPTNCTMSSRPFFWRCLDALTFACVGQIGISNLFNIISVLSVACGHSTPKDWVPGFGYWSNGYRLRNFWSIVWHQFLRRMLSDPGKWLVKTLRIPRGTNLSSYTQLYTAFILSGVLHACAEYSITDHWGYSNALVFFPAQAVGIMFEDAVVYLGRVVGFPKRLGRAIGSVWVLLWFVYTLPVLLVPMASVGFLDQSLLLPFSIVKPLIRRLGYA